MTGPSLLAMPSCLAFFLKAHTQIEAPLGFCFLSLWSFRQPKIMNFAWGINQGCPMFGAALKGHWHISPG